MPTKSSVTKSSKPSSKSVKTVKSTTVNKRIAVVETPVVQTPDTSSIVEDDSDTASKSRRVLSPETIESDFDEIVQYVESEVGKLRESSGKAKGVKFLRSLNKKLKKLQTQTIRVMKQKRKTKRTNNTNSGFLKPVQISKEMAKFTGWNHSDLKSRVDVTKYICQYIRDNNLQNPDDKRQIIADKKLSKLLGYDASTEDEPLRYYSIQSYMKKHFTTPSSK